MTRFAIVLLGLTSLASAKPTFLPVPLTYAAPLTQVISTNGGVDGPEVASARADDKAGANGGTAKLATVGSRLQPGGRQSSSQHVRDGWPLILASSAPLGADGRVVDTPEVVAARAAHAAAHLNERINLANEVARSGGDASDSSDVVDGNPDGEISDVSKVTRVNGKIDLANGARIVNDRVVPLVLGNGVVAALVSVDPDGRPLAVPEVVVRGDHLANDLVSSVDALAVAGPALAYGRLTY